jgi:hypothetical protein
MPKKRVGVSLRTSSPAPESTTDAGQPPQGGAPESRESVIQGLVQREAMPEAESASVDAFVTGAARALSEIPAAKLEEMRRRGPEGYRELTIYLPEALAERLSVHCLEHNLDLSRLVALALEQHLNGAKGPQNDARLAAAARALLSDLAAWVRSAWATRRRHWPSQPTAATSS